MSKPMDCYAPPIWYGFDGRNGRGGDGMVFEKMAREPMMFDAVERMAPMNDFAMDAAPEMEMEMGGVAIKDEPEEASADSDAFSQEVVDAAVYDFMGQCDEMDFRNYMHQLRMDFKPESPVRVDFTETVAFLAGSKFDASAGSRMHLSVPTFYLAE